MTTVSQVMTVHPVTVSPADTVQQVEDIMSEENIRQLPVVKGRELVGIVTDRDIRSFLGGRILDSLTERDRALQTKVAAVMTTKPVSMGPDDDLRDAVEMLIEEKMGGLPVVNSDGVLVGIVTYVDALRFLVELLESSS
jgi:acetoin utilization protein AcuB